MADRASVQHSKNRYSKLDNQFDPRIEAEYVIKDPEGMNDVILCPAHWFDFCFDNDFGCIVNSALRYAIGRHTYMPGVVRDFIRKYMNVLDSRTLVVAIRDIDEELRLGDLDGANEWSLLRSELQARLDEMQDNAKKE